MKKQFKLDEIDCANCARELQDELAKLEGVKSVSVNFMAFNCKATNFFLTITGKC